MIKRMLAAIILIICLGVPVYGYDDVSEFVTDEMDELLPEDILNDDGVINYDSLWDSLTDGAQGVISSVLHNTTSVLAVIVLSALFSVMSKSVGGPGIQRCMSYLSSGCIALCVYNILTVIWGEMTLLMSRINTFMTTLTPITTLVYSMGGNITTAAVNNTAMGIILNVFENICYHGIMPMLRICFGFSIVSALSGSVDLRPLSRFVRRSYSTVLVFSMTAMICVLSLQNMLTIPRDSLAVRTIKFAAAKSIPIVGGALGEAAATVGVGVCTIRSSIGVLGIIAIAIMVLPSVISMWMNKLSFSLMASVCSVYGLTREEELISGGAELLNFALALTISCSVMFIINISLFAAARPIVGG